MKLLTIFLLTLVINGIKLKKVDLNNSNTIKNRQITTDNTPANDWGKGNIHFLDRHIVNCPSGSALAGFHLFRPTPTTISYQKTCLASKGVSSDMIELNTTPQDIDHNPNSSINYLDRQDVRCPDGRALQFFKVERSGPTKIYYRFQCVKINTGDCVNEETDWTDMGSRSNIYLDRQNVKPSKQGHVLTGFKLISTYTGGNRIKYSIKTCQVLNPPQPTPTAPQPTPPAPQPTPAPAPKPTAPQPPFSPQPTSAPQSTPAPKPTPPAHQPNPAPQPTHAPKPTPPSSQPTPPAPQLNPVLKPENGKINSSAFNSSSNLNVTEDEIWNDFNNTNQETENILNSICNSQTGIKDELSKILKLLEATNEKIVTIKSHAFSKQKLYLKYSKIGNMINLAVSQLKRVGDLIEILKCANCDSLSELVEQFNNISTIPGTLDKLLRESMQETKVGMILAFVH